MSSKYQLERSRRSFLKVSAATLVVIGAGGWVASHIADRGAKARLAKTVHLNAQAQAMLAKLADAMLDGALPPDGAARERAIDGVIAAADLAVAALPPYLRKETLDLFGLLGAAPTRALLVGQWTGWADASRADVAAMLDGLRTSGASLRRAVYMGLHDIVIGSYYASAGTWRDIGYPGPRLRWSGVEA